MLLYKLVKHLPILSILFVMSSNSLCSQNVPDGDIIRQWATALHDEDIEQLIRILDQFPQLVHIPDARRITPLGYAAQCNKLNLAQFLLSRGADINQHLGRQKTALYLACLSGGSSADMVRLLVLNGGNVDLRDLDGATPLHWCRDSERARILLDNGADLYAKNISGYLPIHIAVQGEPELIAFYLSLRSDLLHARSHRLRTPLYRAAEYNSERAAKVLVEAGADVNAQDSLGQSPLHVAGREDHHRIVELLLEGDPDMYLKDSEGKTPLYLTAEECRLHNPHPFQQQIPQAQRLAQRRAAVKALLLHGTPIESWGEIAAIRALRSPSFDPQTIIDNSRTGAYTGLLNIQEACGLSALPNEAKSLILAFTTTPKLPEQKRQRVSRSESNTKRKKVRSS